MQKIGNTASFLVVDAESGNALSLVDDTLEIGVEVNLTVEDANDTKQKWDLAKDRRTGWMKLKKPNGFILESSECGEDLIIQGMYFTFKCQILAIEFMNKSLLVILGKIGKGLSRPI